jgi:hypothetical protein
VTNADRLPPFAARFHPLFERWARRVRARLALRHALTGAAIGLLLAMIPAAVAWKTRHGALRFAAPAIGLVGAGVGLAIARRKRWSDSDVALYLDERLDTQETIATAVEMRNDAELDDPARAVVVTSAAEALASRDARRARPTMLRPVHALVPLAAVALAVIARAPLPAVPVVATPPGTAKVQLREAQGLEKIAQLAALDARDDAQRERLQKLAKDAEKLKEDLKSGLEKREAQDRISKLEDALAQERLSLGDGEKRAGLESAVGKLEENELTKKAGKALGDHDLESMDSEMEKIANQREKADRELAKKALDEASLAAKKNGAPDVAKALDEEKSLMDRRGNRAEMLRDLAKGMDKAGESSDDLKNQAESLDRAGSDEAAKKLAESMGKALEKMTPEERKRLADKLRQMAKQKGGASGDPEALKDLADDLATPEGQKKLEDELKDLAKDDTEDGEAKRQQELDDAQNGAQDTERDIGKQGQQGQGQQGQGQQGQGQQGQGQQGQGQQGQGQQGQGQQGQGQQGQGQQGQGQQGQGQQVPIPGGGDPGPGAPGSHHDTGSGDHKGQTNPVDAQSLKSRAKGPMNKGTAMPGSVSTFSQGKAGGTANTRGTGDLKVVGPSEVDGVNRSDVPEEYRDQVRHYFQP